MNSMRTPLFYLERNIGFHSVKLSHMFLVRVAGHWFSVA